MKIFKERKQINKLFIQKGLTGTGVQDILKLVKQQGVVVSEVPKTKLDEMTNNANHQGVVVTLPAFEYQTLEDCFALAESRQEAPFFLILDGIEDPHNLGSIIRTAEATGVHGVIIPKRRAVGLTGIVAKTSAGSIENVPVVRVTNISQVIEQLQSKGVWVFATAMSGEDMRTWNSQGSIALIIGNEGQGVSPKVQAAADGIVTIPMTGTTQSLNASVAAGVLMYEVARHRL
ncbi:23S rRNA (guanosine(2251)-2'-O)-methyltransferase RlmB [Aerococcaceae bacterium zg-ZJ1578]|nr:23S rRNA (guanosine(2251)-2'-O)-methyltransferase RlmB [Aerococcaceae bacterium zg-1578]MBR7927799.1 23S rRNA (guanosine(2251)-2'-O)-methyltransferase RlmB [Aerococcaceae bacterium zg-ZUI334]MBS4462875.1 23S rRNA (guanosine(2251)-2'-O)-methyltransferase RlmB [Aerococcaceae bacterium zg-B36]NEW64998.1 23S rRNA (guanosine(2251)-2'-O)-methyltransferase RlmB [Facklamia sp. 252]NEW68459.1 23S rRNA (guanosine(2251)-2'-O)-methyltransferase RlmB [Facklamia sp. 253]QQD66457.1 23S rRNA (guanosine(225